jgi:putative FmdB family regulatory protein
LPTYEYRCDKCRKRYDLYESFSAPSEHECQKCGKGLAKRVLHAPRVVFKGSGWYVTDSRGSSSAVSDASDSESAPSKKSSESSSNGKGATKAAASKGESTVESSAAS